MYGRVDVRKFKILKTAKSDKANPELVKHIIKQKRQLLITSSMLDPDANDESSISDDPFPIQKVVTNQKAN